MVKKNGGAGDHEFRRGSLGRTGRMVRAQRLSSVHRVPVPSPRGLVGGCPVIICPVTHLKDFIIKPTKVEECPFPRGRFVWALELGANRRGKGVGCVPPSVLGPESSLGWPSPGIKTPAASCSQLGPVLDK